MLFSNNELEDFFKLIDSYHLIYIGQNVDSKLFTNDDKNLLKSFGIDINQFPKETLINSNFKFGVLAEYLGNKDTKNISYIDFKNYVKKGKFIPLTNLEEKVLENIKHQAYHDIKGVSNKIQKTLIQKNIELSTTENVKNRESIRNLVLDLGHKTGEWNRDFGRIADYVMHSSYESGRAAMMEERNKGKDVKVYKDVKIEGACKHCIKLYLDYDLKPKIFLLSELRANGTNIGVKADNWKPTLGSLHPHCRCTLQYYEEGTTWNEKTRMFEFLESNFVRKVATKSKIKITIGDKVYER
jgi:hypothetical protein